MALCVNDNIGIMYNKQQQIQLADKSSAMSKEQIHKELNFKSNEKN